MSVKIGSLDATFRYGGNIVDKICKGSVEVYAASPATDYLCFTAQQANSTVELKRSGNPSIAPLL